MLYGIDSGIVSTVITQPTFLEYFAPFHRELTVLRDVTVEYLGMCACSNPAQQQVSRVRWSAHLEPVRCSASSLQDGVPISWVSIVACSLYGSNNS